ncbi:hypothetical protein BN1723_001801 [Verticillium longisporum]|uniref:Uncharacterized protein n=1 Tax=Verticillium longisporum TaxID=100787 RepID=A0A0G4KNZ1_VERLO|nr:hypothetical protein BN1723_001801 [Verticillium longisporum]
MHITHPAPLSGDTNRASRLDLPALLASSRVWYHLSLHPTDDSPASLAALPSVTSAWSAGTVSRQLRAWRLPEWANRRNKNLDFTADFDVEEFVQRYSALGCKDGRDGIETWLLERGWSNGEVIVGKERVWMRESAWWEAESMLDLKPLNNLPGVGNMMAVNQLESGYSNNGSGYFPGQVILDDHSGSNGVVNHQRNFSHGNMSQATFNQNPVAAPSIAPTRMTGMTGMRNVAVGDYGLGHKGDTHKGAVYYNEDGEFIGPLDPELANGKQIETKSLPMKRRVWVFIVWAFTWWIPSPLLRYVGRMKRPDVRMAWREKLVLCFFIFLMNALIVFWIVAFGRLLCPNFDKAYSQKEVDTHQGQSDFWVSIHGKVYDISKFWKQQHSDQDIETTRENMLPLAGMNLDDYFVAPLPLTCPGLDIEDTFRLDLNNTLEFQIADHTSGYYQPNPATKLRAADWYSKRFEPRIKEYFHGDLVWSKGTVRKQGENDGRQWVIYDDKIYDLTNYFYTQKRLKNLGGSNFLNEKLINVIKQNPGADVTDQWNDILERAAGNATENQSAQNSMNCIRNTFYKGITDFRETPRCTVNNWLLLAFSIMLCAVILLKFVSALQFGSKRRPSPQDKFVICQVPAYTEGEESLRKALDSLTALQYDNKRKLICVICDGVIVGQGNDRPTPKIVLDILGDNFSWGNTRIVIGEKGNKQIVAVDDEGYDPRSVPLQRWDDYAQANQLPGRRGGYPEKYEGEYQDQYEMDEMKSVYSSVRQGSVITGMQNRQNPYMPPQSPALFGTPSPGHMTRHSTMTGAGPFADPHLAHRQSMASMGAHDIQRTQSPYADYPTRSMGNLHGHASNPSLMGGNRSSTALGFAGGNRAAEASSSTFDFQRGLAGPDDGMIVEAIRTVLMEVDLDTVTKKQVRALVEQRLQSELVGERRTFMDRQIDHELANM